MLLNLASITTKQQLLEVRSVEPLTNDNTIHSLSSDFELLLQNTQFLVTWVWSRLNYNILAFFWIWAITPKYTTIGHLSAESLELQYSFLVRPFWIISSIPQIFFSYLNEYELSLDSLSIFFTNSSIEIM